MNGLPVTGRMAARPMWKRYVNRMNRLLLPPVSDDDIRDAIAVLREVHVEGHTGWWMAAMQLEAEIVMDTAGR